MRSVNVRSHSRSPGLAGKVKPADVRTDAGLSVVLEAVIPVQVLTPDGGLLIACQEIALPQTSLGLFRRLLVEGRRWGPWPILPVSLPQLP